MKKYIGYILYAFPYLPAISKYLNDNRISLEDLAKKCNVSKQTLWNLLVRGGSPSLSTINKLIKGTGLTFEELFAEDDTKKEIIPPFCPRNSGRYPWKEEEE